MTEIAPINAPAPWPRSEQAEQGPQENRRQLRVMLTPGFGVFNYSYYNFAQYPEEMRLVPPHPGDPGSQTAPVEYRGQAFAGPMSVSAQLTFDLFQYLTLNYKYHYRWTSSADTKQDAELKTKYTSGAGAYTYIAIDDGGSTQSFTIGLVPYRHNMSSQGEFMFIVEAGESLAKYSYFNGWERHDEPNWFPVYQRKPATSRGLAISLNAQLLNIQKPGATSFVYGWKGGLDFEYYGPGHYRICVNLFSFPLGVGF